MKETYVTFPVIINKFKQHEKLKEKLLTAINEQKEFKPLKVHEQNIERCDWDTSRFDKEREWYKILYEPLHKHLEKWCTHLKYEYFEIHEMWFQQYTTGGKHAWHTHGDNFTNVYYLDLPQDSSQTEWIGPVTGNIHKFDVAEGDIITFPSWLIHRGPINLSSKMKTIISWNLEVSISDLYGENNGS